MKFVCDNCKAKYQIGDNKVAGKTVRMKCRKCGYNIKVTPGGIEVADAPSMDMPSHDFEAPVSMAAPVVPAPAPAAPARSTWGADDESTSIMTAPVRDAVAEVVSPAAPLRPAPAPKPPPPRPVTMAPHAPRPVTAGATPRPFTPPPRPAGAGGVPSARPVSRQSSASMAAVHHEPTPHPAPHAPLHAAPHAPLHAAPQAAAPEVEWYVGIGGSPIGPVRVSVIRERAAAHEVDGESLVWREGMGEWRPLRTIPELIEVVTAALSPRLPSTPTPTPFAAAAIAEPPRAPAPPVVAPAPLAVAPAPVAFTPAPAAFTPAPAAFTPAPVAPAPPAPAPLQVVADPFAPPPASSANGKANGFHVEPAVPAPAVSAPAAIPSAPRAPAPSDDIDPALEAALIPRRRGGLHPMAYAFIAAAAVFSGVAAYVLIPRPPPQIVLVNAPAPSGAAAPAVSVADKGSEGQVEVGELSTVPGSTAVRLGGPRPKASATASVAAVSSPIDTSGFIHNIPGPAATAADGPSPSGGQLSQGEISGVVAQNQPRVRRKCWQPALDGAPLNGPKNARVSVSITIGGSGSVESASASGAERDFPGLSSCIGGMVRGWKFPASGGSTQVSVPFMFAGQ